MVGPQLLEVKASNWFLEIIQKQKPQMSDMPTNKIQENQQGPDIGRVGYKE